MLYDHIVSKLPKGRISEIFKRAPIDANDPKKLSKITGISLEDIRLMEVGELEPTLNMAFKLAAAFQIPLDTLFADDQKIQLSAKKKKTSKKLAL